MGKSRAFQRAVLDHIFLNTAITLVGDAAGLLPSASAGSLYVGLASADPGEAGDQTTNEVVFTGYQRMSVPRSSAGWVRTGDVIDNVATIVFPMCDEGVAEATYFTIGTAATGAGSLLYSAPLQSVLQGAFTAKADDVITIPGHTLAVNNKVMFNSIFGIPLPTGITEGVFYFVLTVSGNDITISATLGGTVIDITAAGAGRATKVASLSIVAGISLMFSIGALDVTED